MKNFENNKTFQTVMKLINGSRMQQKIKDDFSNISFKRTKLNNYCIFIDDICAGIFIDRTLVDENDFKELNWKVKGKME